MNIPERSPDIRVDRINELADNIEVSETYEQNRWHRCGSPCCVGGHAVVLFDKDFDYFLVEEGMATEAYITKSGESRNISIQAQELLGLDCMQAFDLFTDGVEDIFTPTAEDAAEVLRHLARTYFVDWQICLL